MAKTQARKRQARRKKNQPDSNVILGRYIKQGLFHSGILLLLLSVVFLLTLLASFDSTDPGWSQTSGAPTRHPMGSIAAWLTDIIFYCIGYCAYLIPLALLYFGWRLLPWSSSLTRPNSIKELAFFRLLGAVLTLGAGCGLANLVLPPISTTISAGGIFGYLSSSLFTQSFALTAEISATLLLLLAIWGLSLLTDWSLLRMVDALGKACWVLIRALLAPFIPLQQPERQTQPATSSQSNLKISKPETDEALFDSENRQQLLITARNVAQRLFADTQEQVRPLLDKVQRRFGKRGTRQEPFIGQTNDEPIVDDSLDFAAIDKIERPSPTKQKTKTKTSTSNPKANRKTSSKRQQNLKDDVGNNWPTQLEPAQDSPLPSLSLLDKAAEGDFGYTPQMLESMAERLKTLLSDFGIDVEVVNAVPGPVITRFELDPAPGVKVSQISNLAKDLARGLSVVSVRVVEVIPGKPYIGLEIPNEQRAIVALSEILGSQSYRKLTSPLTLGLGKDIAGHSIVSDLAVMPHLLVAGTTGSGKSVALNAMLLSILYKATPQQVRLIMVDPKMLELAIYEDIPHLLAPVVTDMKEAANALRWCVAEMDRRYRLMAATKVRNIDGFNRAINAAAKKDKPLTDPLHNEQDESEPAILEPLPYIVVVIDELADMMMTVGKKVEELIVRLAQKARASGIHLILATQRPSVDVITGLIKSNVRSRIAFQVASKVDSRTILDQMGAETLLGHGDMLFLPPGKGFPERVHGAFVSDQEVQQVVDFLRSFGGPDYSDSILDEPVAGSDTGLPSELNTVSGETDPLYDQAVRIVIETRRASVSNIQRRLGIGYNRAARLVEAMEQAQLVGPQQSNGMREVLVNPPDSQA